MNKDIEPDRSIIDYNDIADGCPGCDFAQMPPSNADLANLPAPLCRVIQELKILFDIARTLQEGGELQDVMSGLLHEISEVIGLHNGTLRIMNRAINEAHVEAVQEVLRGIATNEVERFNQIAARVIEKGEAEIIPDIARPMHVVHGTAVQSVDWRVLAQGKGVFICVPVARTNEVLGTLSVISHSKTVVSLQADLRLLMLIAQMIAQAVKQRQRAHEQIDYFRQENERLQEQLKRHFRPGNMIGNSSVMQTVYHSIEQVAASNTTVLIRGESGVGKELVAHAVHERSSRSGKPFVKINCAALPESIVESELFGHERGAFTGAIAMRKGRFELAHRGTIFLDEVGELPLQTQAKLLRILQEKEFERVGGTETLRCDVRVIAATNRSLEEFVEQGKFREDLYYRLNVFPVYVPALRERKTDILQLADFFVEKYSVANGKDIKRISTAAIDMLMSYHWPGNVRELENCIERATLLATEDVIHGWHLPPTLQMPESSQPIQESKIKAAIHGVEREFLVDALKTHKGNMAAVARHLGLTERVVGLRVKKYGIDPRSYRP